MNYSKNEIKFDDIDDSIINQSKIVSISYYLIKFQIVTFYLNG